MTIASGTLEYQLGTAPVIGYGFSYSDTELDTALFGSVTALEELDNALRKECS